MILRNSATSAALLDGYALYDKDARDGKYDSPDFIFPAGTRIPAGGTLRVLTGSDLTPDSAAPDTPMFTKGANFLDDTGDRVELSAPDQGARGLHDDLAGRMQRQVRPDHADATRRRHGADHTGSVTIQWGAPISRGGNRDRRVHRHSVRLAERRSGTGHLQHERIGSSNAASLAPSAFRYFAEVVAKNAQGASAPSAPRVLAAPRTVPSAPGSVSVSGTPGGVNVSWRPTAENGAAITKYTASAYTAGTGGNPVGSCTTSNGALSGAPS